jgi:rhamnosyltransferase
MNAVSIIILTKNAEFFLMEILISISQQKFNGDYEVIIIDSGSKDKTIPMVLEFKNILNIKIHKLSPDKFNHGETRNLGGYLSDDCVSFLVYLSQDATPADENWLQNLINPLLQDETVAGVFSRHIPRQSSSPAYVRQLTKNWQTGGNHQIIKSMPESERVFFENRFFYNAFSNTSSAIRKSVWQVIPFEKVPFAEDALWAEKVIRNGYKIVYEPSSRVLHSHDYSLVEQFRQNVDHAWAMKILFNPPEYSKKNYPLKLFLSIPLNVWQDWIFIYNQQPFKTQGLLRKIKYQFHSIGWHTATALGTSVGIFGDKLPKSLIRLLSRQQVIMNQ